MKKLLGLATIFLFVFLTTIAQSYSDRRWDVKQTAQPTSNTATRYVIPESGRYAIQVIGGDVWFQNNATANIGIGFKLSENSTTDFEDNTFNYGEYFTWISSAATTLNIIIAN